MSGGGPSPTGPSRKERLWPSPPVNDDDWESEQQFRWFLLGFNNYQTERKPQRRSVFDWQRRTPPLSMHARPSNLKQASYFEKGFAVLTGPQPAPARRVSRWGGIMGLRPMRRSFFTWQLEGGLPAGLLWLWHRFGNRKIITNKVAFFFFFFLCNSPFYLQMLSMAQK